MTAPEALATELGQRVTQLREEARMSKREFAKTLGISPAYVVYLENGRRSDGTVLVPSDAMLQMICHRFGCSYYWLKTGKGKRHSDLRQRLVARIMNLPDEVLPRLKEDIDNIMKD